MRLLLLLPGRVRGGCEEFARRVSVAAGELGHEVVVAVPFTPANRTIRHELLAAGVELRRWTAGDDARDVEWGTPRRRRLEARAVAEDADAALGIFPWPASAVGVLAGLADRRCPTVALFQLSPVPLALSPEEVDECLAAKATGQVWAAVSHENRRHLAKTFRLDPAEIAVVPNGTSVPDIGDRTVVRAATRATLRIDLDATVIATVARLDPAKRQADVLLAVARSESLRDAHVLVVGEGPTGAALRRMAERLRVRAHFLGFRHDVGALLLSADVFVSASEIEGASFALLEAMAHAVPVVASDASSNPELLAGCGALFPVGDVQALAEAIGGIVAAPAHAASQAARARSLVADRHAEPRRTHELLSLLADVRHRVGSDTVNA